MRARIVGAAVAWLFIAADARAQEPEPPKPDAEEEPSFHRLTVTADVLGVVADRYTVQVEAVLLKHASIVLAPFYLSSQSDGSAEVLAYDHPSQDHAQTVATGLDAQFRWYLPLRAGAVGASGAWIAPGVEWQRFRVSSYECVWDDKGPTSDSYNCGTGAEQSWTYWGVSADVGGQVILPFGGVIGASLGIHYRMPTHDIDDGKLPWTWSLSNGSGFRPRMRIYLGWAFL